MGTTGATHGPSPASTRCRKRESQGYCGPANTRYKSLLLATATSLRPSPSMSPAMAVEKAVLTTKVAADVVVPPVAAAGVMTTPVTAEPRVDFSALEAGVSQLQAGLFQDIKIGAGSLGPIS